MNKLITASMVALLWVAVAAVWMTSKKARQIKWWRGK